MPDGGFRSGCRTALGHRSPGPARWSMASRTVTWCRWRRSAWVGYVSSGAGRHVPFARSFEQEHPNGQARDDSGMEAMGEITTVVREELQR